MAVEKDLDVPRDLLRQKNSIRHCAERQEQQTFNLRKWEKRLELRVNLGYLKQYSGGLNRIDLTHIAQEAIKHSRIEDYRRLFVASMIWGYGGGKKRGRPEAGYGPSRTERILNRGFDPVLQQASSCLRDGMRKGSDFENAIAGAYDTIGGVSGLGPSFFTKYLYFLGRAIDEHNCPLILDTKVAEGLEKLVRKELQRFATVDRKNGKVTFVRRGRDKYMVYLRHMRSWAKELDCKGEDIECFLYEESAKQSSRRCPGEHE